MCLRANQSGFADDMSCLYRKLCFRAAAVSSFQLGHCLKFRHKCAAVCVQEQRRMFGWYLWHKYAVPRAIGRFLGRSGLITKHWRLDPDIQAAFQAKSIMGFYDTWVARYALHPDHAFHSKALSKLSRWTAILQLLHPRTFD